MHGFYVPEYVMEASRLLGSRVELKPSHFFTSGVTSVSLESLFHTLSQSILFTLESAALVGEHNLNIA